MNHEGFQNTKKPFPNLPRATIMSRRANKLGSPNLHNPALNNLHASLAFYIPHSHAPGKQFEFRKGSKVTYTVGAAGNLIRNK